MNRSWCPVSAVLVEVTEGRALAQLQCGRCGRVHRPGGSRAGCAVCVHTARLQRAGTPTRLPQGSVGLCSLLVGKATRGYVRSERTEEMGRIFPPSPPQRPSSLPCRPGPLASCGSLRQSRVSKFVLGTICCSLCWLLDSWRSPAAGWRAQC